MLRHIAGSTNQENHQSESSSQTRGTKVTCTKGCQTNLRPTVSINNDDTISENCDDQNTTDEKPVCCTICGILSYFENFISFYNFDFLNDKFCRAVVAVTQHPEMAKIKTWPMQEMFLITSNLYFFCGYEIFLEFENFEFCFVTFAIRI